MRIARLSEEHAILDVPVSLDWNVGDRVRILPNHACATVNLHDRLVVVDGDAVQWHAEWQAWEDPVSRPLFRAFGDAARAWAGARLAA